MDCNSNNHTPHHRFEFLTVVAKYVKHESTSGILLLLSAIMAMFVANSPLGEHYFHILHQPVGVAIGAKSVTLDVLHWINDAIMAIFFLMVGLEIKREFLIGELSGVQKAAFPIVAAIGGMVVPAVLYYLIADSSGFGQGFGIPMATDIAFALGVLLMLGSRVSLSVKVFLVSLAVVDDIGAIGVIASVYSNGIDFYWLFQAFLILLILGLLNFFNVNRLSIYILLGMLLWVFIFLSGVHATVAGVILAFFIPLRSKISPQVFVSKVYEDIQCFLKNNTGKPILSEQQLNSLESMADMYDKVQNPLVRLEHNLHPVSAYFIMPVFAFANAGVAISTASFDVLHPVFLGVFIGLFLGKPLGIFILTYALTKIGLIQKPENLSWAEVMGVGLLAGIGFTMSIFISNLAFVDQGVIDLAKLSIVSASVCAILAGYIFFALTKPKN